MQHHIIACGDASIAQVLVCWSSLPDSLVTRGKHHALKKKFPRAPIGGKNAFKELMKRDFRASKNWIIKL